MPTRWFSTPTGFLPELPSMAQAIKAAALAGASAIEIKDMREDMSMTRYVTDEAEKKEYQDAWRASGVTCIFQNAGEEGQDPNAPDQASLAIYLCHRHDARFCGQSSATGRCGAGQKRGATLFVSHRERRAADSAMGFDSG